MRPYSAKRVGTTSKPGQSRMARAMGMAERTPKRRAAYEAEVTTPRPEGRPPTAKGLPRSEGVAQLFHGAVKSIEIEVNDFAGQGLVE